MANFNFNNSGVFLSSLAVVQAVLCFAWLLLPLQLTAGERTIEGMPILQRLQFGSGSPALRSRSLYNLDSNSDNLRELQDQGRQELGRFAFQFPVTTFQETLKHRSKESNSMSNAQAIALVVLSFTLVMNWVFVFWIRQSRRIHHTNSNSNNTLIINNYTDDEGKGLVVKRGESSKRTKSGRSFDCEDGVVDTKRKKPKRTKSGRSINCEDDVVTKRTKPKRTKSERSTGRTSTRSIDCEDVVDDTKQKKPQFGV